MIDAERPYPRYGELTVTLGGDYQWYVAVTFRYELQPGVIGAIYPGRRTDFVSARKLAELALSSTTIARARRPALVHDADYRLARVPRKQADQRFRDGLEVEGVGMLARGAMYWAVRVGGWASYRG